MISKRLGRQLFVSLVWSTCVLTAQSGPLPAQSETRASPSEALERLLAAPIFDGARVGVYVVDLADRRVLCRHLEEKGFLPASNLKLITVATALELLGPDFRFATRIATTGKLVDGVLHGDLLLIGDGDPTFGSHSERTPTDSFDRIVQGLKETHGMQKVVGDIVAVDTVQADRGMGRGWAAEHATERFAAPVSGLCFADNVIQVTVTPTTPGQPAAVHVQPATAAIRVVGTITTGNAGERSTQRIGRAPDGNVVRVEGRLAVDAEPLQTAFAMHDPTTVAAVTLAERLRLQGIEWTGSTRTEQVGPEKSTTTLQIHHSAPLRKILTNLNKVSQNLHAEQVLRAVTRSAAAPGEPSPAAGIRSAAALAGATLARLSIPIDGIVIADGSGLSRLNLVRPRQLGNLLVAMHAHRDRDTFVGTFPIGGVDGTLRTRFREGPAFGRVLAKTGTLTRVVALSGYLPKPDPTEPPLVFVILANDFVGPAHDAMAAVDRFVQALALSVGWH